MSAATQPRRRYDGSRRQAQATRDPAAGASGPPTTCSSSTGYAATTIAAIAAAAGVSVPTVYAGFPTKADLLRRAIEVAMAGDDDPIPVADRPTFQWVSATDDPRRDAASLRRGVRGDGRPDRADLRRPRRRRRRRPRAGRAAGDVRGPASRGRHDGGRRPRAIAAACPTASTSTMPATSCGWPTRPSCTRSPSSGGGRPSATSRWCGDFLQTLGRGAGPDRHIGGPSADRWRMWSRASAKCRAS